MEALYKKRVALKRLFYEVIDKHAEYSNEQYFLTLDILDSLLKKNKKQINALKLYYSIHQW
jgi:hypothetical protein